MNPVYKDETMIQVIQSGGVEPITSSSTRRKRGKSRKRLLLTVFSHSGPHSAGMGLSLERRGWKWKENVDLRTKPLASIESEWLKQAMPLKEMT